MNRNQDTAITPETAWFLALMGSPVRTLDEKVDDLLAMAQKCDDAADRYIAAVERSLADGTVAKINAEELLHRAAARRVAAEKWRQNIRDLYRRNDRCEDCGEHIADAHEVECPQGDRAGILGRL